MLGLMFCHRCLEIVNDIGTKALHFYFALGPAAPALWILTKFV